MQILISFIIILKALILKEKFVLPTLEAYSVLCTNNTKIIVHRLFVFSFKITKETERKWIICSHPSLCFTSIHPLYKHQSLKLVSKLRSFPEVLYLGERRFPLSRNTPFPVHSTET